VESVGDLLSPNYLTTADFTIEQLTEKIEGIKDIPVREWFSSPVYSDSGTVISINFGDKTFSGKEIRSMLNLRSANFDVTAKENAFTFTVRGYGHLVGMSQYGANYMAQQGSDYKEILKWYYKGTEIS
jgi:stage II sporulation protein D